MKITVVLFVLVLTLIGGAAAGKAKDAEAKKVIKEEDTCKKICVVDKKVKEPACKEACALSQRFKTVWIEALQCSLKCSKKHGIGAPATKPCEEGCKKKYEDKVTEVASSCHEVCTKEEKGPLGVEKCKKICTPSLIYKEMQEQASAGKQH